MQQRAGEWAAPVPTLERRGAPAVVTTGRAGIGSVSAMAWHVRADDAELVAAVPCDAIDHVLAAGDALRYDWLPVAGSPDRYLATRVGIDVELDDGTMIAAAGAVDQYGIAIDPAAQDAARMLWPEQWNRRIVDLGRWHGRRVVRVLVRLVAGAEGWLDGVGIVPAPTLPRDPLDLVDTRRGTHSTARFSRGSTAPLVGLPHGGVLGLPMTDASAHDRPYAYHDHLDDEARPSLQAFATSHLPSPWIGDRGVLQLMPSLLADPPLDRRLRALRFDRDAEVARPHRYDVELEGGITVTLTAARHAIGLRARANAQLSVVVDHLGRARTASIERAEGRLTLDLLLDDERGGLPHHMHARVDAVAHDSLRLVDGALRGAVTFDVECGEAVEVLVGVSTIDAEHARRNLELAGDVDAMLLAARAAWTSVLGRVRVEGASPERTAAVASALHRLHLYPNAHDEPSATGDAEHRDPVSGIVLPGASAANHGFWDTYRTCWPAFALLSPRDAARLADGFLQHYRDTGWTSRWSAPGPIDLMTGTSTDVVFAQLAVDGVELDVETAYASALKNATVPSVRREVGRPGLRPGIFLGYTPSEVPEGLAWTLEDAINDHAIAVLAGWMLERGIGDAATLRAEREYLQRRAHAWRRMLEPTTGMLLGRRTDGAWRIDPSRLDPRVWGFDYTETNAWGTAFSVPLDGGGLAAAHGGERRLGELLDTALSTEETADVAHAGSYGVVIHEQAEARDVRLGMVGMSNQPAHHVPGMFAFAGRHDDAHRLMVEARDRLFVGGDIGQGYPGDEDNGEMSAWFLLASLGLYPLVPASGTFLLTPPSLPRAHITTDRGERLEIVTEGAGLPHIAAVRIDGEPWHDVTVPSSRLRDATRLELDLSAEPCGWASRSRPPSLSDVTPWRVPLTDLLERGEGIVDDRGEQPRRLVAGDRVRARLARRARPGLYTVTARESGTLAWRLLGERADGALVTLDERREAFAWDRQTRPFAVARTDAVVAVHLIALADGVVEQLECFDEGIAPRARARSGARA